MDEHLTPAGLVAALHAAMHHGEMPPAGTAVPAAPGSRTARRGLGAGGGTRPGLRHGRRARRDDDVRRFDGLHRAWEDWGETFSELELIVDDVVEVPAGALVLTRQVGVTRHGGIRMEQDSAMLLRLRDGRIGAIEFHLDPELARRTGDEGATHQ